MFLIMTFSPNDPVLWVLVFAAPGVLARIYLNLWFGGSCGKDGPGWTFCIMSNGLDRQGGALFLDLPSNMLGSLVMGFLHSGPLAASSDPSRRAPLFTALAAHPSLLIGIKTGFCGSFTSFASWILQAVTLMFRRPLAASAPRLGTSWPDALVALLIGTILPLSAYKAGRHLAWFVNDALRPSKERSAFKYFSRRRRGEEKEGGGPNGPPFEQATPATPAAPAAPLASPSGSPRGVHVAVVAPLDDDGGIGGTGFGASPSSYSLNGGRGTGARGESDGEGPSGSGDGQEGHDLDPPRTMGGTAALTKESSRAPVLGAGPHISPDGIEMAPPGGKERGRRGPGSWRKGLWMGPLAVVALVLEAALFILLAVLDNDSVSRQSYWIACLLGFLGAPLRYFLSKTLNPKSWFPLGTFAANMAGCAIDYVTFAVIFGRGDQHRRAAVLWGDAIRLGLAGSLSTVSTWVAELDSLGEKLPLNYRSYGYGAASVVAGTALGCAVFGWSLRV